jgi:hypothetical protein
MPQPCRPRLSRKLRNLSTRVLRDLFGASAAVMVLTTGTLHAAELTPSQIFSASCSGAACSPKIRLSSSSSRPLNLRESSALSLYGDIINFGLTCKTLPVKRLPCWWRKYCTAWGRLDPGGASKEQCRFARPDLQPHILWKGQNAWVWDQLHSAGESLLLCGGISAAALNNSI